MIDDCLIFCPQCRAAQIRVLSTTSAEEPAAGVLRRFKPSSRPAIDWAHALPSIILAVLIAAFLNHALFGGFGVLLCGALAVFFYGQRNKLVPIPRSTAIRLGALSGVLATVVTAFFHFTNEIQQLTAQSIQMTLDRSTDEAAKQSLRDLIAQHPHVLPVMLLFVMGGMFLVISGLGGMIGASLINRWRPAVDLSSEANSEQREKTERSDHD